MPRPKYKEMYLEVKEENRDLRKRLHALESYAPPLHKCKKCDNYYIDGYVCDCGNDNSVEPENNKAELEVRFYIDEEKDVYGIRKLSCGHFETKYFTNAWGFDQTKYDWQPSGGKKWPNKNPISEEEAQKYIKKYLKEWNFG